LSLGALAGAVLLNVDLDVVLSVLDYATCAVLHRCLPGYAITTPGTVQRRFLSASGSTPPIVTRSSCAPVGRRPAMLPG
jgi:hypothetical protein